MVDPSCECRHAPATERNREAILAVLQTVLPPNQTVLEVSSGTGEHAVFFAPRLAPRRWLPSDIDPIALKSIAAWQAQLPSPFLYEPIQLDAAAEVWPVEAEVPTTLQQAGFRIGEIGAIVNINMLHISPWSAGLGVIAAAGRILPPQGVLYFYGPFHQRDRPTAPSNEAFDANLRSRDVQWGLRWLEEVVAAASAVGLHLETTVDMPANNLSVVFRRSP